MHVPGLRQLGDLAIHVAARVDELAFALIPSGQDLGRGRTA